MSDGLIHEALLSRGCNYHRSQLSYVEFLRIVSLIEHCTLIICYSLLPASSQRNNLATKCIASGSIATLFHLQRPSKRTDWRPSRNMRSFQKCQSRTLRFGWTRDGQGEDREEQQDVNKDERQRKEKSNERTIWTGSQWWPVARKQKWLAFRAAPWRRKSPPNTRRWHGSRYSFFQLGWIFLPLTTKATGISRGRRAPFSRPTWRVRRGFTIDSETDEGNFVEEHGGRFHVRRNEKCVKKGAEPKNYYASNQRERAGSFQTGSSSALFSASKLEPSAERIRKGATSPRHGQKRKKEGTNI